MAGMTAAVALRDIVVLCYSFCDCRPLVPSAQTALTRLEDIYEHRSRFHSRLRRNQQ